MCYSIPWAPAKGDFRHDPEAGNKKRMGGWVNSKSERSRRAPIIAGKGMVLTKVGVALVRVPVEVRAVHA